MDKKKEKASVFTILLILCLSCMVILAGEIGYFLGSFNMALDFSNSYDIKELEYKYNQTKEVIYINSTCSLDKRDIELAKQDLYIIYKDRGYLILEDLY